jgi:DNA helicase II / ATP-dependent DNA helicase PcrA
MNLNPSQNKIVEHDGHIIAAAPPGSGKTRVIVERAKRVLKQGTTSVKLVTFTKAAANEMKARVGDQGKKGRIEAATFDSYCLRMARAAGMPYTPANALNEYIVKRSIGVEEGIGIEEIEEAMAPAATRLEPGKAPANAHALYKRYTDKLRAQGKLDFASIARGVVNNMWNGQRIRPLRAQHILVDEFQDADEIQVMWVLAHAKLGGAQIMVVGDDDQSIYGFRGGLGYQAMKRIEKELGAAIITLDTCYRCRPEVIEHSRLLIANNKNRFHKPTMAPRPIGGLVRHFAAPDTSRAVSFITSTVNHFKPPVFAILGRTNRDLDQYNADLSALGMKVLRIGGKPFWSSPGARAMIRILDVVLDRTNEAALKEVLAYISVDHTEDDLVLEIIKQGTTKGRLDPLVLEVKKDLVEVILSLKDKRDLEQQRAVVKKLVMFVEDHRKSGWKDGKAAMTAIIAIQKRLAADPEMTLKKLVDQIEGGWGQAQDDEASADAVLATMHGAKGKEWPMVFIVNANEENTPKIILDSNVMHPQEVIEEERRLFYVALTRAEDHAIVVSVTIPGTRKEFVPSRFIEEAKILETGGDWGSTPGYKEEPIKEAS